MKKKLVLLISCFFILLNSFSIEPQTSVEDKPQKISSSLSMRIAKNIFSIADELKQIIVLVIIGNDGIPLITLRHKNSLFCTFRQLH